MLSCRGILEHFCGQLQPSAPPIETVEMSCFKSGLLLLWFCWGSQDLDNLLAQMASPVISDRDRVMLVQLFCTVYYFWAEQARRILNSFYGGMEKRKGGEAAAASCYPSLISSSVVDFDVLAFFEFMS